MFIFSDMQNFCSNLRYNENAQRRQAQTIGEQLRWSIVYPRAKKGQKQWQDHFKKSLHMVPFLITFMYLPLALERNAINWKLSAHPHSLH